MKLGHQEQVEEAKAQLEEEETNWTKGAKGMEEEEEVTEEVEQMEEAPTTLMQMQHKVR